MVYCHTLLLIVKICTSENIPFWLPALTGSLSFPASLNQWSLTSVLLRIFFKIDIRPVASRVKMRKAFNKKTLHWPWKQGKIILKQVHCLAGVVSNYLVKTESNSADTCILKLWKQYLLKLNYILMIQLLQMPNVSFFLFFNFFNSYNFIFQFPTENSTLCPRSKPLQITNGFESNLPIIWNKISLTDGSYSLSRWSREYKWSFPTGLCNILQRFLLNSI